MKSGRAPGPTVVKSDLLKRAGITGELTTVFRSTVDEEEIPEDWKNSVTVPIYKGKGDALECGGVQLLEHGMKLFQKVLEERLRKLIEVDCRQFGFNPGRSTTDAVFVMRILQKFREKKKKLYHVFVDLEKAFEYQGKRLSEH